MENKALAYIRVSTDDQTNSLQVQKEKILQYCLFHNILLVETFTDENISGGTEFKKRPGGKLASTKLIDIKTIIAVKPDRLFRNTVDALLTVEQWNKQNINLHIVDLGGASFSTSTAIGRFIFTNLIAMSEFEKNVTGERTKDVLQSKKASLKTYSGPILGYDQVNGLLIPNPTEQEIISTIKTLSSKNFKPNRIARILNNTGSRTKNNLKFFASTIQRILKNKIHS